MFTSYIVLLHAALRAMAAAPLLPKQQRWLFYVFYRLPFPPDTPPQSHSVAIRRPVVMVRLPVLLIPKPPIVHVGKLQPIIHLAALDKAPSEVTGRDAGEASVGIPGL